METMSRTFVGSGQRFLKDRPIVQISEKSGFYSEGSPARMIEEKQTFRQFIEVNLVAHNENIGVFQEIIPGLPCHAADCASFERQ